ncbi:hypothetical protein AAF852_000241 [Yersinia enterocolitica]
MKIFASEKEMQEWLETKLSMTEGLSEVIDNIQSIKDYIPKNLSEDKIKQSFLYCIESIHMIESLTQNENISSTKGHSLKPDIFAYAPETESIVIIELKNQVGATREAGTELSAYASEIKSALSYLSDGEIINVIVSPTWPTLLKHHLYNNIFWQGKNTICLEPFIKDDEISLKIIEIPLLVQADIPNKISEEHLGGYHICLYDNSQYETPRPASKLYQYLPLIKTSISAMSTKGEKMNTHGFTFLSEGSILSPYFITLVNAAPFKSIERILHSDDINSYLDLPLIEKKILDTYLEYSPEGHGSSLNSLCDTASIMLKNICSPAAEGFTSWSDLKNHILNNCTPVYFESWGIFKDIAIKKLSDKYENGKYDMDLNSVSLGFEVIEEIIDKDYQYINPHYLPNEFFPKDHPRHDEEQHFDEELINEDFPDSDIF